MWIRTVLASAVVALVVGAIFFSFVRANAGRGAKSRKAMRIERPDSRQAPALHLEWTDPNSGLTPAKRDELLRSPVIVGDFCRQYPKGCATLVDQVTEMLTPGNQLAPELLKCRFAYETSSSREVCDAGRRMIVEKESETQGRVIYIGFEAGQSTESECVALQRCLRDVFASALLRWPQGYDEKYVVYGQAPWIPGYHPRLSHRERYVGLLRHAQEGLDFHYDLLKEIDLDQISEEKRSFLEYQRITSLGKKQDAEMMLRAIESRTGAP